MQFYLAIDGEKRGPYAAYRIIDQLRAGELSPDTLAWEPGMESWKILREIPSFAEAIQQMVDAPERGEADETPVIPPDPRGPRPERMGGPSGETVGDGITPRPFARFWARSFDYLLVSAVAWQFCEVPALPENLTPMDLLKNDGSFINQDAMIAMAKIHYAALLIWHLLEGVLLHFLGTTPGKWLLGVRVRTLEGDALPLNRSLGRPFLVWGVGFGLGLFPFYLVGLGAGLYLLLIRGTTLWDRWLGVRVEHAPMTPTRILMVIGGFLLLMILSSLKFS